MTKPKKYHTRLQTSKNLLLKVIRRGGLYGKCATLYINEPLKRQQFLMECADQCNKVMAKKLWGKNLIKEIQKFKIQVDNGGL